MSYSTPAAAFDRKMLKSICEMRERNFAKTFGLDMYETPKSRWTPDAFFAFKNNGGSILAVAHLDTVVSNKDRTARFVNTGSAGPVVHSGALDDRLGAYVILDMLPKLGITTDVLLTTGEESGESTAEHFRIEKDYDWIIEFDRGGTDVVMYQYEDAATKALVRDCGAKVGQGSFSDIAYLEQLGVKAFNWGVGYRDYHSTRGHAYLHDTFDMVECFQTFYEQNEGNRLPHLTRDDRAAQAEADAYADYASALRGLPYGDLHSAAHRYASDDTYDSMFDPRWYSTDYDDQDIPDEWRDFHLANTYLSKEGF